MMFLTKILQKPSSPFHPSIHNIETLAKGSSASNPIRIEPEPHKERNEINNTTGKSPISSSLNDKISLVKNSQQGESPDCNNVDTRLISLEESMTSISKLCSSISQKLDIVFDNSSTNSTRLSTVEHRVDELDKSVKTYVDAKFKSAIDQVSSLNNTIPPNVFNGPFEALKREIKSLRHKQLCDENAISIISETIANVKDQIDSTIDDTAQYSRSKINRENEQNLIHDSIESSAKLIRQLIAVKVSIHSELSSIKKSNDDVKKVTAYTKTCQDLWNT